MALTKLFILRHIIIVYRLTKIEERLQVLENAQLMGLANHTIVADGALTKILIDLLKNLDTLPSVIQNRRI